MPNEGRVGKRITKNLTGSNLYTNNTCQFGSMAGLNPTVGVRPNVTGIHGYKYLRTAANGVDWNSGASLNSADVANGCGFLRTCIEGTNCLKMMGTAGTGTFIRHDPVRNRNMLG
jgi:hypothetical protein|uniref:Uncharacterized protein n=1 Tax=viral metagenome TaxID=1070528 RepID=A0A6C0KU61_9ZZZZ